MLLDNRLSHLIQTLRFLDLLQRIACIKLLQSFHRWILRAHFLHDNFRPSHMFNWALLLLMLLEGRSGPADLLFLDCGSFLAFLLLAWLRVVRVSVTQLVVVLVVQVFGTQRLLQFRLYSLSDWGVGLFHNELGRHYHWVWSVASEMGRGSWLVFWHFSSCSRLFLDLNLLLFLRRLYS